MPNINEMEAGRELDIRIAELLTGQSRLECRTDPMNRDGEPQFYWGYFVGHVFVPNYSTDLNACATMEKRLEEMGKSDAYLLALWGIAFESEISGYEDQITVRESWHLATAPPLLRCRAALLAMEGSNGK